MILKLKEIIWEITGKCDIRCKHCGSKDVWDSEINEDNIRKITDIISEYPPEEIDISGGNPLLVSLETHKYIAEKLKFVKRKIIVNVKSLEDVAHEDILNLYDHVGISVNTEEDCEIYKKLFDNVFWLPKNRTIITNFNLENVFNFNNIYNLLRKDLDALWMIQFTVFKNEDDSLAIYNNTSALEFLQNKIAEAMLSNKKIVISDNAMNNHCTAGGNTLGILYNGDVIPCLSMRSWCDLNSEGNLLSESLKDIWENKFKEYRFSEFKCCKDHCKRKLLLSDKYKYEIKEIPADFTLPKDINQNFPYVAAYYAVITYPYNPVPYEISVSAYAVKSGTYITIDKGVKIT